MFDIILTVLTVLGCFFFITKYSTKSDEILNRMIDTDNAGYSITALKVAYRKYRSGYYLYWSLLVVTISLTIIHYKF